MQPVPNFDFFGDFRVMEETAIAKNVWIFAKNNCEGRR